MEWIGESTALYFYSAVFQGNMALLGVRAVFVIFRTQWLDGAAATIGNRMFEHVDAVVRLNSSGDAFPIGTTDALHLESRLTDLSREYKEPHIHHDKFGRSFDMLCSDHMLLSSRQRLISLTGQLQVVKTAFRSRLWIVLISIILPLILLPLVSVVHQTCACAEFAGIVATILATVVAIGEISYLAWRAFS
jgi:hypothetical protein